METLTEDRVGEFIGWMQLVTVTRRIGIREYLNTDLDSRELAKTITVETMEHAMADNPDAGCFTLHGYPDHETLTSVLVIRGYRDTSHAIANLVLCGFRPFPLCGQADGYPNLWSLYRVPNSMISVVPTHDFKEWRRWLMLK